MGATTKLTLDEWLRLPELEGTIYELDEGELLMEPSPTLSHNRIRDRIARCLTDFVPSLNETELFSGLKFSMSLSDIFRD